MGLSLGCSVPLPPCRSDSPCRLPTTAPRWLLPTQKLTSAAPQGRSHCPKFSAHSLPACSHLLPPKALSMGVHCCSLLSGRKSRTGSAIQLLGTQANFLISLGLSFSLRGMGTIMGYSTYPMGLLGESN